MRLPAFAKINLHLQVVGKRADGYHELRTIFQTVDLADAVDVELGGSDVALTVHGAELSAGPENLAHRAAAGFLARWAPGQGVRIRLEKRIPMGGGLGGGSSDAATVLRALQVLLGAPAPGAELWELARGLGADVPFFLVGGTALGVGRGDEIVPLPDLPACDITLALPPVHVPTAQVFSGLNQLTPAHLDARINHLVQRGNLGWGAFVHAANDLEGPAFRRWPELAAVHAALKEAGAVTRLSGSGAAIWALFDGSQPPDLERRMPTGIRLVRVRTLTRDAIASAESGGSG
jgi:4-diphosphocytidyl-2-C-methyl-D-erythritol kinase